ncbi:hypothetical protein [Lacimicrobium alkaliphilum]|uniref:Lipoprotein n=1 Tax=Lacimicrobium alkaliphilum TaxID=1526571 RepID=A0A0U2RLQ4_9ALTE|nr:hypothetical protein [Lacimicrobium alkaliphilum]ALS98234.1 hypothetical protein AT746_08225 [Lacimicrobium alkaliphilum]
MLYKKSLFMVAITLAMSACTTGRLEYVTPQGETKFACETEYTWQPSVDKFAVEYVLAYCARQAAEQGNQVVRKELLELDLSVPEPPQGEVWSYELARKHHKQGRLTDKEYGYLIAYIDLGQDKH